VLDPSGTFHVSRSWALRRRPSCMSSTRCWRVSRCSNATRRLRFPELLDKLFLPEAARSARAASAKTGRSSPQGAPPETGGAQADGARDAGERRDRAGRGAVGPHRPRRRTDIWRSDTLHRAIPVRTQPQLAANGRYPLAVWTTTFVLSLIQSSLRPSRRWAVEELPLDERSVYTVRLSRKSRPRACFRVAEGHRRRQRLHHGG